MTHVTHVMYIYGPYTDKQVLALRRMRGAFGAALAAASAGGAAGGPAEDAEENVAKLGAIVKKYSGRL